MSFRDIKNIRQEYQTLKSELASEFYIPCLREATVYKRAVGYFSSSILLDISKGLGSIAQRNGRIELIVAPTLSENDYNAIKKGYDIRKYAEKKLLDSFDEFIEYEQKEDRFGMLAYLIQSNILNIKVVVLEQQHDNAIFHDKLGIMIDEEGNEISFSGSANETENAINYNYENIDVFCSWTSQDSEMRCASKKARFNRLWKGTEKGLITIEFPQAIKDTLFKYSCKYENFMKLDDEIIDKYRRAKHNSHTPSLDSVKLRDYQLSAIEAWKQNRFRGIYDMATGTGKTFTACGSIAKLYDESERLFVWICCPFTHLVEQWAKEVQLFNIKPIVCFGDFKKYKDKLKRNVIKFKRKRTDFVCVLITNQSFCKDRIQDLVKENLNDTLLIVDEAHNFGADQLSECLNINYPYRLALSATLDRYGDTAGTEKLYNFFEKKCFTYTLQEAIVNDKLTKYNYYPVLVILTKQELQRYEDLTQKIKKLMRYQQRDANENVKNIPEEVKHLLIKRARVIAGAENKINTLKEKLQPYKKDNNILVYCGAVKYGDYGYNNISEEVRQIDEVSRMMTQELKMKVSQFTSSENTQQRQDIISAFKNEELQALVAIKCLDEGMNVPSIKTAFILASSTNPKEYIQRRGRVLRKAKGKKIAEIYDFITLPRSLDEAKRGLYDIENDIGLVKRELSRVIDFSNLANNPTYCNDLIDSIYNAFNIDTIMGDVDIYE